MKKLLFPFLVFICFYGYSQKNIEVTKDILWASPEGFDLTMDIYHVPETAKPLPVLIIFHGGGWLINNKSIMDEMAAYVAENGDYVVCNVNYRLLGDQENTVTINEIIEDALGAVIWINEHISEYGGNPDMMAVTGDSAGGHLAESVVLFNDDLSENRFKVKMATQKLGYLPSYLPKGVSAQEAQEQELAKVETAVISYGAFDLYAAAQGGFEKDANFLWQMGGAKARPLFGEGTSVEKNPAFYKAVSPFYNVPQAIERQLPPQFFTVGSKDNTTTPQSIKAYVEKLNQAGQETEFWMYEGRPHAFLDSGANEFLGTSFKKDAPEALDLMIEFLDKHLD
ncbi:MAG: lipase [Cytophagaceae bacterium]|nr:lipase [Cytophagaceae bacterium]|tara:strand:- start:20796 stop:21812 length:1017 start_codon:yes stop_codon:yes gene_type:complete